MEQKSKNILLLFVISLILIPSLIYGGTTRVAKEQAATTKTASLKRIVVSPKALQVPKGTSEEELKQMIEVKAYYKDVAQPKIIKKYQTDYTAMKPQKGSKTIVIKYTEGGCTKTHKICITFCEPVPEQTPQPLIDQVTDKIINFPYISGYPDNTFRPNQAVTRAEFATMIARLLSKNDIPRAENQFTDVPALKFSTDAINYVTNLGIMKPYEDGSFRPGAPVTLDEARAIIPRLAAYLKTTSVEVPTGEGDLTRTQAVVLLNRLFDITCNVEDKTSGFSDVTPSTPYYKDIICATRQRVTPKL